ncbi:glycerate dehydrogenase [Lepidopterella palustris CBS 459.81]|uniref:Glycerate dehydrogenase n=1 Tax=Lepidopterella palustris CBS 459.81 TaxID=1314670 RepID=A0A8E2EEC5_9PEZI|nr:glycerate dehydrogenase [Lepidopterella palustris CBS 459.81]
MHHHIVALERIHQPLPEFTFAPPTTHTLTVYQRTEPEELHERIRDATIIIITVVKIDADALSPSVTPNLRLVAVMATGTDPVDLDACRKRGIRVTNCPAANIESVSEHAIALYFAARRRVVQLHNSILTEPSEWKAKNTLTHLLRYKDGNCPLTCQDEFMGIIGYGSLGKRIAQLGIALGMTVLIAARKSPTDPSELPPSNHEDRVPFDEVLRRSTVLVLCLPRTPETLNLISTSELQSMSPHAILINIARGGIVDEHALVTALQKGWIAGAATDVLAVEPAKSVDDSPLLGEQAKELNITVSPHLAWFSQRTMVNLSQIQKETVEGWVEGHEINVIV